MTLAGMSAGLLARGLSFFWPRAARRFGLWYRHQTVRFPRWCSPISWEPTIKIGQQTMRAPFSEIQGMSLLLEGCWEAELTERIKVHLSPGDVFLDIGANMGYYSLIAAEAVGVDGLVIAVEPSLLNLSRLLSNLQLNRC